MAQARFHKRDFANKPLTKTEDSIGLALNEIENSSTEAKNEFKELKITSVQEIEVDNKKGRVRTIFLIYYPFPLVRLVQQNHRKLVTELEKRFKNVGILFVAKRGIQSKWVKLHKSQTRPFSRTLSSVYDAILDDFCLPSTIIGRRTRVRLDGSQIVKITLDQNDKDILEDKVEAIATVYKKLTTRDVIFEFRADTPFHTLKKR